MYSQDDRGERVRLCRIPCGVIDSQSRTSFREIPQQTARMHRATRFGCMMWFALAGIAIMLVGSAAADVRFLSVVFYPVLAAAMFLLGRRVWRIDAMAHLPRQGWCAACVYRIEGLPLQEDGCIVCPECGAAWQIPIPVDRAKDESNFDGHMTSDENPR